MPSRNRVKQYTENGFYHVYNRGVNKQIIFRESDDYHVFLNLFKRYLSTNPVVDKKGREYPWLKQEIELMAYCLMPNHFHLLLFQIDREAMTKLLRAVCTSYTGYFNKKYGRVGPLFQGVFKASLISSEAYLQHISRYIHLNPADYLAWEYSSLRYYLGQKTADWLNPGLILEMFNDTSYLDFLADYGEHKKMLEEIKYELANSKFPRSDLGNRVIR